MWAGKIRAIRRLDPRRNGLPDRLGEFLKSDQLSNTIDLAIRRNARRAGSHAVLHGQIDQLSALSNVWTIATSNEVREHVAAVMRAGLRRDDRIALGKDNAFTITIPGADERTAVRIADRLRRKLGMLHLPQLGREARLTASFGVAAEQFGDGEYGLDTRARRALDAAVAKGADHIVPASEIEEIIMLPAPAPSPAVPLKPSASAA